MLDSGAFGCPSGCGQVALGQEQVYTERRAAIQSR
jgi:hypothetical protein